MFMPRLIVAATLATIAASQSGAALARCNAHSGPNTTALVELYTSEGCSSCPPADRQLTRLEPALESAAEFVPLSLHVGYWDYIGWKDAYAQEIFGERQSRLIRKNRLQTVYTPQFFVGGSALKSWPGGLRDEVRRVNAEPAGATIQVQARQIVTGTLTVSAEATTSVNAAPALLYLALTESGLVSRVTRGENSGVTLAHDHVVRAWIGPIRLTDGIARIQREILLPADWNRGQLDLVAFVEDDRSGRIVQALRARHCSAS